MKNCPDIFCGALPSASGGWCERLSGSDPLQRGAGELPGGAWNLAPGGLQELAGTANFQLRGEAVESHDHVGGLPLLWVQGLHVCLLDEELECSAGLQDLDSRL